MVVYPGKVSTMSPLELARQRLLGEFNHTITQYNPNDPIASYTRGCIATLKYAIGTVESVQIGQGERIELTQLKGV